MNKNERGFSFGLARQHMAEAKGKLAADTVEVLLRQVSLYSEEIRCLLRLLFLFIFIRVGLV